MHVCPMVNPVLIPIPHVGGPILPPGCPTVLIGGQPAARSGDMTLCVGPPDVIAMGEATVLIGGTPAARLGDMTAHGGAVVMGCSTVLIGSGAGGAGGAGAAAFSAVSKAYSGEKAVVEPVPESQAGPLDQEKSKQEKSWIGIVLRDHDGKAIPDQDFQITMDSGRILKGRTDSQGRFQTKGLDPDQGEVAFTQIPMGKEPDESDELETAEQGAREDPIRLSLDDPPCPPAADSKEWSPPLLHEDVDEDEDGDEDGG